MKKNDDFEIISAYVDNELPPEKKEATRQMIESSDDLKKELEEIIKLKDLTSKVKSVPESPYFEARLFESIKSGHKPQHKFFRGYYPAVGIAVFTVFLMFLFKFNTKDIDRLIEKQRFNIVDLYAKNLKPILYNADVTKEDIFNFAFYNELPIDKVNHQYLSLGTEKNGKNYFEIKNASYFPETNNLEKFMSTLNLNKHQRKQVDSILESYISDLRPQILANEKNTIAINSNLVTMNKAIAADLLNFAQNVNKTALTHIMPAAYKFTEAPVVSQMIRKVKNNNDEDTYIFITPDTIFSEPFKFDMDEFDKEMQKMTKELERQHKNMKGFSIIPKLNHDVFKNMNKEIAKLKRQNKLKLNNKDFSLFFDTNYCKIEIPKFDFPNFELPDFDSIASEIEKATSQFRQFSIDDDGVIVYKKDGKIQKYKNKKDSIRIYGYKSPNFFKPGDPFNMRMFDSLKGEKHGNWMAFGDSIGKVIQNLFTDSLGLNEQKSMKDQMKILNEQMRRFQKELQRMQEDMQNIKPEKKEKKKKDPIEINSKRYYFKKITPIIA